MLRILFIHTSFSVLRIRTILHMYTPGYSGGLLCARGCRLVRWRGAIVYRMQAMANCNCNWINCNCKFKLNNIKASVSRGKNSQALENTVVRRGAADSGGGKKPDE